MAAASTAIPTAAEAWRETLPRRGRVGILALIITESVFFSIFVVAYIFYLGKSVTGPFPKGRPLAPDSEYHLPAIEQRNYRSCDPSVARRFDSHVRYLVVHHLCARTGVSDRHCPRMASTHLPRQSHDSDQPFRDHLLLSCRSACAPRYGGITIDSARDGSDYVRLHERPSRRTN